MNEDVNQYAEFKKIPDNQQALETPFIVPVIHEQLHITKEVIDIAKVKIRKNVSEQNQVVDIPFTYEEVDIERVSINKYLDNAPAAVRYEGETMIMSVLEEIMVIEKRILLVEEVRITKRQVKKTQTHQVTLSKEEVVVQREQLNNL